MFSAFQLNNDEQETADFSLAAPGMNERCSQLAYQV
jgi:hypothetical protein